MREPLNAQTVRAVTAGPGERKVLNDSFTPGLELRVRGPSKRRSTVVKTWSHRFYLHGQERRRSFGDYPDLSLSEAREVVRRRVELIKAGVDPDQDRRDARNADRSFAALCRIVLDAKAKTTRPKTQELRRDAVDRYLVPAWGSRPANQISRADVIKLIEDIRDGGKGITANRVRSLANLIFNEGMYREFGGRGWLVANPVHGTKPPLKVEPTRDRFLDRREIATLWRVLEDQNPLTEGIGKLAILTGQRIGQVVRARWDMIDGEVWTTPPDHHKGNRLVKTPLSTVALEVVDRLHEIATDDRWVFPARAGSRSPHISNVSAKTLQRIRKQAALAEPWTWHDIRRTLRVWMVSPSDHPRTPGLGVRVDVVDYGILTHKERSLGLQRYTPDSERAWHLYAEKRSALQRWGEFVRNAVEEWRKMERAQDYAG